MMKFGFSRSCLKVADSVKGRSIGFSLTLAVAAAIAAPLAAQAQKPAVVISQARLLGVTGGGVLSGTSSAGTSIGLTTTGNIILGNTYGNSVVQINGTTGTATTLGSFSGAQAIAVDTSNNIYITTYGSNAIVKVPYLASGTYPAISTYASGTTPACTGSDTAECVLKALTTTYIYGYQSLAFDPSGNFYFVTAYNPYYSGANTTNGTIYKCSATCFSGANSGTTGNAAALYQDPQPTGGSITVVGGLAVDALGDVFFTDSTFASATAVTNLASSSSNLKELPVLASAMTGYAAAATNLYTFTVTTPGNYDDELDAVSVGPSNTVYFGTQYSGTFGMLNNAGTVDTTSIYAVSPQGAKVSTTDRNGKFYVIDYSNTAGADAGSTIYVGLATATTAAVGATSSTTGISAVLNTGSTCTNAPTTTVTSSTTEFSATGGTCASTGLINAPVIPLTVSFTPSAPGTRTATLTATNGTNTGTATITGVATGGTVATPTFSPAGGTYSSTQTVTIVDTTSGATIYYTLDGSTPTTSSTVYSGPITVSSTKTINAIATYAGSTNSAVATATFTIQAAVAATPTFSPGTGSYTTTQTVTISDTTSGATIYYTLDGSTPTTASTVYTAPIMISSTKTISAIAVASGFSNSAVGTATYTVNLESTFVINQDGTVSRINGAGSTLATSTAPTASSSTLGGLALDSAGNVWAVTNQANSVTKVSSAGAFVASYTGGGLSNPVSVAIDGLGNVWVANTNNSISEFVASGTAVSSTTAFTGGNMSVPSSIRIDTTGSVWVTNSGNSSVTRILGAAAPSVTPLVTGVINGTTGTRP